MPLHQQAFRVLTDAVDKAVHQPLHVVIVEDVQVVINVVTAQRVDKHKTGGEK
jgi:hypothetical protein